MAQNGPSLVRGQEPIHARDGRPLRPMNLGQHVPDDGGSNPVAPATVQPMSQDECDSLEQFSRACRSAIRAVSLYPADHPAIVTSIARLSAAGHQLTAEGPVTLEVSPAGLTLEGRTAERPDPALEEVGSLLHRRLVSALTVGASVSEQGWLALVELLGRAPEDLMAAGGIASAWQATGRSDFELREFDYADVLRERGAGGAATWERLIARCLRNEAGPDGQDGTVFLATACEPEFLAPFLERLQQSAEDGGVSVQACVRGLLQLIQAAHEAGIALDAATGEGVLTAMASSCAVLTPDAMLALLDERRAANTPTGQTAASIVSRIGRDTVVSFIAQSLRSGQSMERLALALCVLVPPAERPWALEIVRGEARAEDLPLDTDLDDLWHATNDLVRSYSDEGIVSAEYGRELMGATRQAIEIERIADDPPERIRDWLSSVLPPVLEHLDLVLLVDLLKLEDDELWETTGSIVASEIERRAAAGDAAAAQTLLDALTSAATGRPALEAPQGRLVEMLATGSLVESVAGHLRTVDDHEAAGFTRLLASFGDDIVQPVTEALARQTDEQAIRRLGALLLTFGPAGRRGVEQLKNSTNPAVRRTAVGLLRAAGGHEALSELSSMLSDSDPEVRTESLQAIVAIGTNGAYQVLLRWLLRTRVSHEATIRELIAMRDQRTGPLFCYVLANSVPRGGLVQTHLLMLEALGASGENAEAARVLQQALHRGEWWAPRRTRALRTAAASALRRLGTPGALNVLESAVRTGRRGARRAAQEQLALARRAA